MSANPQEPTHNPDDHRDCIRFRIQYEGNSPVLFDMTPGFIRQLSNEDLGYIIYTQAEQALQTRETYD